MKIISGIFSAFLLLVGLSYAVVSMSAQIMTGEHAATLACACFLFVIALGVWQDDSKHQKWVEELLQEQLQRMPKQEPPANQVHPQEQYFQEQRKWK